MKIVLCLLLPMSIVHSIIPMESTTPSQQELDDAFYRAIAANDEKTMKKLHKQGANPNALCPAGMEKTCRGIEKGSALMCAICVPNTWFIYELLSWSADPSYRAPNKMNALLVAVRTQHENAFNSVFRRIHADQESFYDLSEVMQFAHELNEKLKSDEYRGIPLDKEIRSYIDEISNLSLKNNTDLARTDRRGRILLHYAAPYAAEDILKKLLQKLAKQKISIDQLDIDGKTPLYLTQINRHAGSNLLIEYGANLYAGEKHIFTDFLNSFLHPYRSPGTNLIYAPDHESIIYACNTIKGILLALKRICPRLPKDLRHIILHMLEARQKSYLGECIINCKLQGKSYPHEFEEYGINELYDQTTLAIWSAGQDAKLAAGKKRAEILGQEEFERHFGKDIRANIIERWKEPKLLCNNATEAMPWLKKE